MTVFRLEDISPWAQSERDGGDLDRLVTAAQDAPIRNLRISPSAISLSSWRRPANIAKPISKVYQFLQRHSLKKTATPQQELQKPLVYPLQVVRSELNLAARELYTEQHTLAQPRNSSASRYFTRRGSESTPLIHRHPTPYLAKRINQLIKESAQARQRSMFKIETKFVRAVTTKKNICFDTDGGRQRKEAGRRRFKAEEGHPLDRILSRLS